MGIDIMHIDQHLGGLSAPGHSLEGVVITQDGKKGHGIELIEVGASEPEEVADHQVRGLGGQEVGQGVEDIEHVLPFFCDEGVRLAGKRLETAVCIEHIGGDPGLVFDERRVLRKAHVHDLASLRDGPAHKGCHEGAAIIDGIDLPDNIVSCAQRVDDLIEVLKTCTHPFNKFAHGTSTFVCPDILLLPSLAIVF